MGSPVQPAESAPSTGGPTAFGVLGALEAIRGDTRLSLPRSAKTRALLGYLLVEPRPFSREHLCALLWETSADARSGLRWSLSKLRPLLEGRLHATRDEVGLEPDDASVDLWRARALLARAPEARPPEALAAVLALFRGPLLEGLEVREAYRFQAWSTAKREEVKGQHAELLRSLSQQLAATPAAALPYARALLALDPTDEDAHRRVMALLSALGRRAEALAQYDACREVLAATRGTRPAPETESLRRSLGVGAPATPASPPPPPPAPPRWPLVGREPECVLLERALLQPSAAPRQAWLLRGEPGIGKTRLLDELATRLTQAGAVVLRGRAFEAELVRPYGVWVDAIRASGLLQTRGPGFRDDLAALFGELGPAPDSVDRTRLFDALATLLATRLPGGRGVVLLDDVHWLDEASSSLAHYLLRALPGLSFVAAGRPGEMDENAGVARLLRALQHDGLLGELELLPLGRADIAGLLASHGWQVDAVHVHRASEGNPLLALEVGRALSEGRGVLDESLEQLVLQRVVDLDLPARALLDSAAAFGRSWPLALLSRTSGEPGPAFLEAMGRLERRGILRPLGDGERYEFSHDLVREAVYGQIPGARRAVLHGHIAASLQAELPTSPSLAGIVAHHALLGGEDVLAVRASLVAARQALRVCAEEEALALADRALPLVSRLPVAEQLRVKMELHEVRLLTRRLAPQEVEQTRKEVLAVLAQAQGAGSADVEAVGYALLAHEAYTRHDSPTALPMSLRGADAARLAVDPETRARALAQAGRCLAMVSRDPQRCAQLLDEAEGEARRTGTCVPDIALGRGLLAHVLGHTVEARAQLEQAAAQAQELGDAWRQTEALFDLTRMSLEMGALSSARSDIERALPPAERLAAGSEPAVARGLKALVELREARAAGRPEAEPLARFEGACRELERIDAGFRIVRLLLLRAAADLEAGRTPDVEEAARRIHGFLPQLEEESVAAEVHSLLAGAWMKQGDERQARVHLSRARNALIPGATVPCFLRQRIDRLVAQLGAEEGGPI